MDTTENRPWVVYTLSDPRSPDAVRYVGVTHNTPRARLGRHISDARKAKATHHSAGWIRSLLRVGVEPLVKIIDEGAGPSWVASEVYWIAWHKEQGFDLTNHAVGGQGPVGCVRSPETRAKLSAANRGKKQSPALVEKRIAPMRGRVVSDETRAKQSASMTGFKPSPETCAKIRASKASPEYREKMASSSRRVYADRKARGLVKSQVGKKMSAESRAKMSAAAKARRERKQNLMGEEHAAT